MGFNDFLKPELLILIPILVAFGSQLKAAPKIPDWCIPLVLEAMGILFASIYVAATYATYENMWMAIFTGATQGMLYGLSAIGVNQTVKQTSQKA